MIKILSPRMMYPSTATQSEPPRNYFTFEKRPVHYEEAPRSMGLRQIDIPRPIEPRPDYQTHASLHDSRPADVSSSGPSTNGYRLSNQTLPGLRDILPPTSRVSPRSSHAAWAPAPVPPPQQHSTHEQRNHDAPYQRPLGLHPPLALYPSESNGAYPGHDRRLELPILETQPVRPALPAQTHPISPYAQYPDARDFVDPRQERQRQASTSSYITNSVSVPSPYTPLTAEDASQRNSIAAYDRAGNPPFTPTGAEASKKYLGVKDYQEGSFHVYEGGFRIPTHVDGDLVNPQWGLTKANKPRKRLALACLDCREKKIKCEPGASSCLQCEKAKRPCRRAPNQLPSGENAPNATWSSAGSPPHPRPTERISDPTSQTNRMSEHVATPVNRLSEQDLMTKRRAQDEPSAPAVPAKKHKSASPIMPSGGGPITMQPTSYGVPHEQKPMPLSSVQNGFTWKDDPFAVDPGLTMQLLDSYFAYVNNTTYCIFPRNAFLRWVTTARKEGDQCQNERMLLYAMLAMGSIFADHSFSGIGARCADIASEAAAGKLGSFGLPLVQTRLLLALYNFAKGAEGLAWDYCGLVIRALSALRYNNEEGCIVPEASRGQERAEVYVYGFTKEQIAECRRRTFWSGFLMDRYNGFLGGLCCGINTGDIFLRLPCHDDMFERSIPSDAPFFNNRTVDAGTATLTASSPVSPMAWLVLVSAIWGDAMTFIYRATHHGRATYRQAYEQAYADAESALQGWASRLPEHLQYNERNLDRSIQGDYAGTFISFHTLYHFVMLKLSRCMRHALAPDLVPRNIRVAHFHAHQVLRIMCDVHSSRRTTMHPGTGHPTTFVFSAPFAGYAIVSAIDIVGAGGSESNIGQTLDGIAGGNECLRELVQFWHSAKKQHTDGNKRFYQLKCVIDRPFKATHGCWLGKHWGFEGPIEDDIDTEGDCIYGVHEKIYFAALEEDQGKGRAPPGSLRIA